MDARQQATERAKAMYTAMPDLNDIASLIVNSHTQGERAAYVEGALSREGELQALRELVQTLVDACHLVQQRRGPFHRDIEAERAITKAAEQGFQPATP